MRVLLNPINGIQQQALEKKKKGFIDRANITAWHPPQRKLKENHHLIISFTTV